MFEVRMSAYSDYGLQVAKLFRELSDLGRRVVKIDSVLREAPCDPFAAAITRVIRLYREFYNSDPCPSHESIEASLVSPQEKEDCLIRIKVCIYKLDALCVVLHRLFPDDDPLSVLVEDFLINM